MAESGYLDAPSSVDGAVTSTSRAAPDPMPPGPTTARHAAGTARSIWPSAFRLLAVAAAVLLVSVGSITAISTWRLSGRIRSVPIPGETDPSPAALDGSFNVLLVGADNAAGQHAFGAAREGARNDVDILVHVSKDHTRGTVISFPRDLVIPQPACTDPATGRTAAAATALPINSAIGRGGLGCVVTTVEHLTGLDIPYAALFSFEGTVRMADAVGGVPVCVTAPINDPDSGLHLKKGTTVVTGRTALAYLRERHDIGDGSDLGRIASQQAYMSALLRKTTSAGTLTDPAKLYRLANATAENVTLSESLAGLDRMVRMGLAVKSIDLDHMVFVQYPNRTDPADTEKVVPNAALADRLMGRVRHDRPVALGRHALGVSATAATTPPSSGTGPASPSPTPTASDHAVIDGLSGTTASQRTCTTVRRPRE